MAKYKIAPKRHTKKLILSTDSYGDADEEIYFIAKGKDLISSEERFEGKALSTPEKGYAFYLFNRIICLMGLRYEYTHSGTTPASTADTTSVTEDVSF